MALKRLISINTSTFNQLISNSAILSSLNLAYNGQNFHMGNRSFFIVEKIILTFTYLDHTLKKKKTNKRDLSSRTSDNHVLSDV